MIIVESDLAGWTNSVDPELIEKAVRQTFAATPFASLAMVQVQVEISIRLTNDTEVRTLNRQYRNKDKPTNVLSFPMVQPDLIESIANSDESEVLLGDIVLAQETCAREAAERDITIEAHAAHLIVHGVLHLLGYDHMTDHQAEAMEAIERDIMAALGLHDPYQIED